MSEQDMDAMEPILLEGIESLPEDYQNLFKEKLLYCSMDDTGVISLHVHKSIDAKKEEEISEALYDWIVASTGKRYTHFMLERFS
jgi:hypothetical protein